MLPSAQGEVVGVLIGSFRSSVPSPPMPLFMLRGTPHDMPRKTRGRADRYSLLVKLFHLLLPIGLSRRTPFPPDPPTKKGDGYDFPPRPTLVER